MEHDNIHSMKFSTFVLDKRNRTYLEEGESILVQYSEDGKPSRFYNDKKKRVNETEDQPIVLVSSVMTYYNLNNE